MITNNASNCPNCGGGLKYYDSVGRFIKSKGGVRKKIKMKRFRCVECKRLHRETPETVIPYKQYESEVITGVLYGYITPDTIGFEDYPCEVTMDRWSRELHILL